MSGVRPDVFDLPYEPDFDDDTRLLRAAGPIVERLVERLGLPTMSVILTDRRARILKRWADPGLQAHLDTVLAAPGFVYSEELAGTNGLGTTLEHGRPAVIVGGEHFCERLLAMTCVGVPLVDPMTGRLEGVIDLTCQEPETSPLMLPLALQTADEITSALLDDASVTQRRLLDEFSRVRAASRQAVVAVSNDVVITNRQAARLLAPEDQALVLEQAARALTDGDGRISELVLSSEIHSSARCTPVLEGDRLVGAVVAFTPRRNDSPLRRQEAAERASGGSPVVRPTAGRGCTWRTCVSEARRAIAASVPILLVGEPGTGKATLGRLLLEDDGEDVTDIDAATADLESAGTWSDRLRAAATSGAPLLLRHAHLLSPRACSVAAAHLGLRPDGARTVVTAPVDAAELGALAPLLTLGVHVPSLRRRREDLAELLGEYRGTAEGPADWSLTPQALQALMAHDWPGNLRELYTLAAVLNGNRRRGPIGLEDLPTRYRHPARTRVLGRLEQVEVDAITAELADSGGNRQLAAERLGISRSTLYRKLAQYRLDPELRGAPPALGN